jgi:hypothetical protein
VAPEIAVAQASGAGSGDQGEPRAWYVDPGEWYAARDEPLALASQAGSGTD